MVEHKLALWWSDTPPCRINLETAGFPKLSWGGGGSDIANPELRTPLHKDKVFGPNVIEGLYCKCS